MRDSIALYWNEQNVENINLLDDICQLNYWSLILNQMKIERLNKNLGKKTLDFINSLNFIPKNTENKLFGAIYEK